MSATPAMAADGDDSLRVNLDFRTFYINRDFDQGIPEHDLMLDLTHMRGEADGDLYGNENYDSNLTGLSLHLHVAHVDDDEGVVPRINDIRLIADYRTNLL